MLLHGGGDQGGLLVRGKAREADEKNACMASLLPEDEITKVLIGGDQESGLLCGVREDQLVFNAGVLLSYIKD